MKARILVCIAAAAAFTAFGASAKKGSSLKKAISLKASQTATLVEEYDPEEKEFLESGVAYYTMTLKRGIPYTVWISGGNAADIDLDVDTHDTYYEDREDEPSAGFDIDEIDGGNIKVAYLYADDWDVEEDGDPKSGKYQVTLTGEIGAQTTLGFTSGIRNFTKVGTAESPKALTMGTSLKTFSGKLVDGEYYFRASLKAGRKYRVRTQGGTKASPLDLTVDGVNENYDPGDATDTARLVNSNNDAIVMVPDTNGKYEFVVSGDTSQAFKFQYQMVPDRKITAHPSIPLLEENGYSATFVPGRIANTQNYYDTIIDEHLCKIYLNKGERWAFETEGAANAIQMVAYNSSGKVLAVNESIDGESFDTRVVITASAAGVYYVGVCDPVLDVDDVPTGAPIKLTARNTTSLTPADSFDPVDDVYATASQIVPYPATTNDTAVAYTIDLADAESLGAIHGPHRFNAADTYDVYAIPCRKGYTYMLRAAFADTNEVSNLALDAKLFYIRSGKEVNVSYTGTVSPAYAAASMEADLTFKAAVNAMYYLRVWVKDGKGLDFPAYNLYAIAANGTNELGLVKCVMEGGVGSWAYNGDASSYANGAVLAVKTTADHSQTPWTGDKPSLKYPQYKGWTASNLPSGWTWDTKNGVLKGTATTSFNVKFSKKITVNKKATTTNVTERVVIGEKPIVKFNAVTGYTVSPDSVLTNVPAWNPGGEPVTVSARYSDIYDAKYVMSYTTKTTTKNGKKTTTKVANYSPADGDATPTGAFAITPAAKAATLKRTLWTTDPADTFKFTAATNVYYNFKVESTLADGSGDATIIVSNATAGVLYTGTEISRALLPVGVNYVIVSHGTDEKADSAYTLTFSKAAGGVVRFTNAKGTAAVSTFTVKEGTAAATLYVQRTGTEGAMRVRYATQAGTATPSTNYYPVVDGELSWADGNKAVKTIKINLIPDAMAQWEASNKVFTVRLYPVDEYDLADGEYLPRIAGDTATVTIVESSKKLPGTVSLASYGADEAVPNVKKPVVTGTAGTPLTLTFTRTDGTDGPVSVKVSSPTAAQAKTNKDTALVGKDYEAFDTQLDWEDGDDAPKTVTVNLLPSANYAASKKFIFNIAAVKTDGTLPTLAAKTATLTILNDTVAETAAAYAKTIAAATGLKLASTTGTWFNDYDGALRSGAANGTLTYTLTGPGFFACTPTVVTANPEDAATLTCQFVNKTAKLNETVTDFSGRLARVIPAGTTTVKFTLSGVTGGAYVKFTPQEDGSPYVWGRFADVTSAAWSKDGMPALMDKSVVKKDDVQTLAWTLPAVLAAESNLYCRVRLGTTAKPTEVHGYDKDHAEAVPPEDFSYEDGKTYYWALDYAYTDAESPEFADLKALTWTPGPSTWSFSTLKAGAPITSIVAESKDAAGNSVADLVAAGEAVELIQCVQPDIDLDGTEDGYTTKMENLFRLVGGTLPKGVKINAESGILTGAPTTPGEYTALLQSYKRTQTGSKKVKGKTTPVYGPNVYGTTIPVTFKVLPVGTMIGSFRGVLQEANGELTNDARRLGLFTLTTTAAGKITAKATIGGIAYSFSGTAGFDELLDRDETAPGCTRHVQVKLNATVKKLNSKKKVVASDVATLTLTLGDGALTNAVALAEAAGTVELNINVLNSAKTAWVEDVDYTATLYRNNGATELGAEALASFEGYYTAALAPEGVAPADGVPAGNGYLTFTVAKTGVVKVAGSLADGTAVSFSTIGQLVGDTLEDPTACKLVIPAFAGSAAYAFGGDAKIALPAAGEYPVVLPEAKLVWVKNAAKTTSHDGTAFAISVAPTGGWYDKVVNLQNYYLSRKFAVSAAETGDDLPAEALTKNYSFSTLSSPNDLEVSFNGNALSVGAQKLVKNKTTGLTDFNTSVNPWNTTVKLNRATGLVSGTFNAWEWIVKNDLDGFYYDTAQKQITKLAHKGVLLYSRDDSTDSPLADNVLTAGYFLMPATTSTKAATIKATWKASLPFNILTVNDDAFDWDEKEFDD